MKNELKIIDVPITSRLHLTYPLLSVLLHPDGKKYLFNSFLNLECVNNDSHDLSFCFLSQLNISHPSWFHTLNDIVFLVPAVEKQNIIKELLKQIDDNRYIYIKLDDYYLPNKSSYMKYQYFHINLIYGYDLTRQEFLSIGYDNKNIYTKISIPFLELEQSYEPTMTNEIECFKPDYTKVFNFTIDNLVLELKDFLYSENTIVTKKDADYHGISKADFSYGKDVFTVYKNYVKHVFEKDTELDIRTPQVLIEYCAIMQERIKFLIADYGYVQLAPEIKHWGDLLEKCRIYKTFTIIYNLTGRKKTKDQILPYTAQIEESFCSCISNLYECITNRLTHSDSENYIVNQKL